MYPAPTRLVEAIGSEDISRSLQRRGFGRGVGRSSALGIRINIPFSRRPADACGCVQVVTRRRGSAERYLRGLDDEVRLASRAIGRRQEVSEIHLGGATPLFMSDEQLARILVLLGEAFLVRADAEISIEVTDALLTPERAEHLRVAGFDRLVLRVDSEDGECRNERFIESANAVRACRFSAVTVDLACGDPSRAARSLARGLERVSALRPGRIRLLGGTAIQDTRPACLHSSLHWTASALAASQLLMAAGYVHLGLNEFALASDPLAVAFRHGRLQLGVCGYSARAEPDILALGVSAIGRIGSLVYRNVDALTSFYDELAIGRLPVARGLALSRDELARQGVITGLVCQGRVDYESINLAHLIDMRTQFACEFDLLAPLVEAGLVDVDREGIELTSAGRWLAPAVACVFDRELQRDIARNRQAIVE